MGEFKRLDRKLSYEGKILKVYTDHVQVNGLESDWDFIHHNGGAAVVSENKNFARRNLIRQF